eukprot:4821580-Heterocapsa_arctica.AAC.1
MVLEECGHFLPITSRIVASVLGQQVQGTHVARAKTLDTVQNLLFPRGEFVLREVTPGGGK